MIAEQKKHQNNNVKEFLQENDFQDYTAYFRTSFGFRRRAETVASSHVSFPHTEDAVLLQAHWDQKRLRE